MKRIVFFIQVLFLMFTVDVFGCTETYDIVITSGLVYDGSGGAPFVADVGIKDGRIAAVGQFKYEAPMVISAKELIVCPGFIDIHNHASFRKYNPERQKIPANIDDTNAFGTLLTREVFHCSPDLSVPPPFSLSISFSRFVM